jgi:outer membrane protein OmpA-like peptidoglycan-associated protein
VKKYIFWNFLLLLLLWGIGIFLFLGPTEESIGKAVGVSLSDPKHDGTFDKVRHAVSGQVVTLSGQVASEEDKTAAETLVRKEIRTPDVQPQRNPVIDVRNNIEVHAPLRQRPWLIASVFGTEKRIEGVLKEPNHRTALMTALNQQIPAADEKAKSRANQILLDEKSWPASNWDQTLSTLPDFKKLLEGKADLAARAIAVSRVDGEWKVYGPEATDAEIATYLADANVSEKQVSLALQNLRTMRSAAEIEKERSEQFAKMQAEQEAKSLQDTKRIADEMAAAEKAAREKAENEAAAKKAPAFVGLSGTAKELSVFGAVPNEQEKTNALQAVTTAFAGAKIDSQALVLDPQRELAAQGAWKFTAAPSDAPFVGIFPHGADGKFFAADVFDSELSQSFPGLVANASTWSSALQTFRVAQTKAGTLTLDEPYLNLLSDGKKITLAGEIADDASKATLIDAVKKANAGLTLDDQLTISPLVKTVKDLGATVAKVPTFQANMSGIAIARPGQEWRSAVIHSIYFQTGSDRSKDQERAVAQMQRVKSLLPNARFEIVGHTDNVGKKEANTKLSEERAKAFVAYAKAAGIDAALLTARGAGPDEPIAPNTTDAGNALNRRVDVMLK